MGILILVPLFGEVLGLGRMQKIGLILSDRLSPQGGVYPRVLSKRSHNPINILGMGFGGGGGITNDWCISVRPSLEREILFISCDTLESITHKIMYHI